MQDARGTTMDGSEALSILCCLAVFCEKTCRPKRSSATDGWSAPLRRRSWPWLLVLEMGQENTPSFEWVNVRVW